MIEQRPARKPRRLNMALDMQALNEAMGSGRAHELSDLERRAITGRFVADISNLQLALELGTTPSKVKAAQIKGLIKLGGIIIP